MEEEARDQRGKQKQEQQQEEERTTTNASGGTGMSFAACEVDRLVEATNTLSENGTSGAAIAIDAVGAGASSLLDHGDDAADHFTVVVRGAQSGAESEREEKGSCCSEDDDVDDGGGGDLAIPVVQPQQEQREQETEVLGKVNGDDYQSLTELRPTMEMSMRGGTSTFSAMYSGGSSDSNLGGAVDGEEEQEWSPIRDPEAAAAAAPEEWSPIRDPLSLPVAVTAGMGGAVPAPASNPLSGDDEDAISCDMELDDDDDVEVLGGEVVHGLESSSIAAGPLNAATSREEEDAAALGQRREVVRRDGGGEGGEGGGAVESIFGAGFEVTADEQPPLKRKKLPDLGRNAAVVQITYENLTRESRNFLQAALQSWSYWHSRKYSSLNLESMATGVLGGTEVYSPVLTVEPTSNADPISVWMDRPSKSRQEASLLQEAQDSRTLLESREREKDVPLYDRGYSALLSSEGSADRADRYAGGELEDVTRCFNCGSYTHSLRDCSRPRSAANINSARNKLLNKRGSSSLSRTPSRYYESSPGGKYDDLKPGVLRAEARKALGIEELDPPPWLNRMRELGYPPGYLEYQDNDLSGVEIIGEGIDSSSTRQEIGEGGDPNGELVTPNITREAPTRPKEIVKFPGINAPIPENADEKLWEPRVETQLLLQLEQHPPSRGVKRPFRHMSQSYEGMVDAEGPPGVSTPYFSSSSWGVVDESLDAAADSMTERNLVRIGSVASADHSNALLLNNVRSDWNSHMDGGGSLSPSPTFPAPSSPLVSVDPAAYWLKRRMAEAAAGAAGSFAPGSLDWTSGRSSVGPFPPQHHQQRHRHSHPPFLSPSSKSLSWQTKSRSPLHPPGFGESAMSTPQHHLYPGHDHYHRPFQSPSTLHMANKVSHNASEAWHNAQAALNALKPKPGQTSESILSSNAHHSESSLGSPYRKASRR